MHLEIVPGSGASGCIWVGCISKRPQTDEERRAELLAELAREEEKLAALQAELEALRRRADLLTHLLEQHFVVMLYLHTDN